jgi:hypothetical protein
MSRHMIAKMPVERTTVRLNSSLLDDAKAEAAKADMTLTAFMEEGIRLAIKRHRERSLDRDFDKDWKLPVGVASDGGRLLIPIDFNNSAEMWDILDDLEREGDGSSGR